MRSFPEAYGLGILFAQNPAPSISNGGSCIFLHSGNGQATFGCTTIAQRPLEEIALWLTIKEKPILVQLPRSEYEKLWEIWELPSLPSE